MDWRKDVTEPNNGQFVVVSVTARNVGMKPEELSADGRSQPLPAARLRDPAQPCRGEVASCNTIRRCGRVRRPEVTDHGL